MEKTWKEGEKYQATVRGTHSYRVSVQVKDIETEEVEAICTCPYDFGGACKHIVAAILAFAAEKTPLEDKKPQQRKEEQRIQELITTATTSQLQVFLKKILKEHPHLIRNLEIFLQGAKETPITLTQYKAKFKEELDKLNLDMLLEVWYYSGDSYHDYYPFQNDYDEETLSHLVDSFLGEAEKYLENKNFSESLKIHQAVLEVLVEKEDSLEGNLTELTDWFCEEMSKALSGYVKTIEAAEDLNLTKIGIGYLCSMFEKDHFCY